jgi:glycosyltransferase involved in cell wall biosynthesis
MSEQVDVSVILPIYNTEKFLDQALLSAEQNDRINLEIIAVNDGSTDSSLKIMRAHARRDPRVRVIDKPNQGYGASVNRGFSEARGTYLAILEPDDYLMPHMYDDLFEFARSFGEGSLPDVVKTPYWRVWMPGTPQERKLNCAYYSRIKPPRQPFTVFDCPRVVQHHPSIWSAIYRRGFIEEKGIRFKELPGAGWVDNPFLFETMCQAESIVYKNVPYYCYREDLPGSSSATRVLSLSFERWNDMADVVDRLGITDRGVLKALATIAFRYAGEAISRGALEDDGLTAAMGQMFSRIDDETILSLENVSPQLRALAFSLSGRPVPRISKIGYLKGLLSEFAYSIKINGIGFAAMQTSIYLRRRDAQDKQSESYVDRA